MTNINSTPSQVQGLNSAPPTNSQPLSGPVSSPLKQPPPQAQPQGQPQAPSVPTASGFNAQPTPPSSSAAVPLYNAPRMGGLTSTAGVPSPSMAVVSTSADPTPALPNVSTTPASLYPASAVHSSVSNMATHGPRPTPASASYPYSSYMPMSSSAPAISSQMNAMHHPHPHPQQQSMNYMVNSAAALRHSTSNPHMVNQMAGMMQQQPGMLAQQPGMMQPGMMQSRPRTMVHPGHAHSMVAPHVQQPPMGMHPQMAISRTQQAMGPSLGMGGVMQPGPAGMAMHPGMHHGGYSPRPGMLHAVGPKVGMAMQQHHARLQGQMPHPGMHNPGMAGGMRQAMPSPAHSSPPVPQQPFAMDPSVYQGQMRPGYSLTHGQGSSGLPPPPTHTSTSLPGQMTPPTQQLPPPPPVPNAGLPSAQSMPGQQLPRPPSNGMVQSSPLPSQLASGPGMQQLSVGAPLQPPPPQATPPPQSQGMTPPIVSCA